MVSIFIFLKVYKIYNFYSLHSVLIIMIDFILLCYFIITLLLNIIISLRMTKFFEVLNFLYFLSETLKILIK